MKKRIKQLLAAVMAITTLTAMAMPVYAEEAEAPLRGTFPYTQVTRESVDAKIAEGWALGKDPYAKVGTCTPFTNSAEWSQVNRFYGHELNYGKILITLAGLTPSPDSLTGSALTAEEIAVKEEVVKYLNSYDWKSASDYEKASYTAEYILDRCEYKEVDGNGLQTNSAYSCLIKGFAVCDGFAQTYHLLTRAVGLKSVQISQDFHAFNYVNIDGTWRKIDVSAISTRIDKKGNISKFLNETANDTSQNLWVEAGIEFEFDTTIPNQPQY